MAVLDRTANKNKTFSIGVTTNTNSVLYIITKIFFDTKSTFHIKKSPDENKKASLRKSKTSTTEHEKEKKKLN